MKTKDTQADWNEKFMFHLMMHSGQNFAAYQNWIFKIVNLNIMIK